MSRPQGVSLHLPFPSTIVPHTTTESFVATHQHGKLRCQNHHFGWTGPQSQRSVGFRCTGGDECQVIVGFAGRGGAAQCSVASCTLSPSCCSLSLMYYFAGHFPGSFPFWWDIGSSSDGVLTTGQKSLHKTITSKPLRSSCIHSGFQQDVFQRRATLCDVCPCHRTWTSVGARWRGRHCPTAWSCGAAAGGNDSSERPYQTLGQRASPLTGVGKGPASTAEAPLSTCFEGWQ